MLTRLMICVAALAVTGVHSYGYQQQQGQQQQQPSYTVKPSYYSSPSYYTTVKPYYSSTVPYYTTTTKPYYPVTTYPTTAYYTSTYPTTSYYTTEKAYYQQPVGAAASDYATSTQGYNQQTAPEYTTQGYYDNNDNGWYNYAFKFNVNDYYGNEQSRSETHENSLTRGSYKTILPDGRRQVVTYEADENGYRAQVSYESADSPNNGDTENYYSTSKYGSSVTN